MSRTHTDGKVVANVSVNKLDLMINHELKKALQIKFPTFIKHPELSQA